MSAARDPAPAGAPLRVALVAVGDELLAGAQSDTNSAWLARRLARIGAVVTSIELVGDDEETLAAAVERGLARAELVLVGGGLGPTLDDVTRHGVARALGRELYEDPAALAEVASWFERRGVPMSDTNRRQALFPSGAVLVRNRAGTAPAFRIDLGPQALLALPGPPRELHLIWNEEVEPWLGARGWARRPRAEHAFYLFGIPESTFAERSGDWMAREADPLVGCTVRDGTLSAVLRARADTPDSLERLERRTAEFRQRFAAEIYSESDWDIELVLGRELLARGLSVSLAESCTGGLAAGLLTRVPGVSRSLEQAWVTYSNRAKTRLLGVPEEDLRRYGAVSREVAEAMARGAARASGCDLAVAVTGIAGPDGGSAEKPVGLVCFATALGDEVLSTERRFPPVDRDTIRRLAARTALFLAWRRLAAAAARSD